MTPTQHIQEHQRIGLGSFASKISISETLGGTGSAQTTNTWQIAEDRTFDPTGNSTCGAAFTAAGSTITHTNYTFINGDAVKVWSSGTLPSPLVAGTTYYIVNAAAGSSGLATTPGGAAISFSGGSGTHKVVGLPPSAPFSISAGWGNFTSQAYSDPVICFGFNKQPGGKITSGVVGSSWNIESDYYSPGNSCQVTETYFEHINRSAASTVRPLFFVVPNDEVSQAAKGYVANALIAAGGVRGANGLSVVAYLTGDQQYNTLCNIRKNGFELYYDNNTTVVQSFLFNPQGSVIYMQLGSYSGGYPAQIRMYSNPGGGNAAGGMVLGDTPGNPSGLNNTAIFGADCVNASNGIYAARFRGKATMTVPIVNVEDASGGVLWSKNYEGSETWKLITAPTGNPAAGFMKLYFDVADNLLKFRDSAGAVHVITSS